MARPKAKELTERELEVMHVFWERGETTAPEVREALAAQGRDLAYTTVATLVRILHEKEFLQQTGDERPFKFRPARSYEDVSGSLLGDLIDNTLKTQDDVEKVLRAPFLGLLPLIEAGVRQSKNRGDNIISTRERDLYVVQHPKSAMAEW